MIRFYELESKGVDSTIINVDTIIKLYSFRDMDGMKYFVMTDYNNDSKTYTVTGRDFEALKVVCNVVKASDIENREDL